MVLKHATIWELHSEPGDIGQHLWALGTWFVSIRRVWAGRSSLQILPGPLWSHSSLLCCRQWSCRPQNSITWLLLESGGGEGLSPLWQMLPLFKVVCARLDILCLKHEPSIFQDCLAHLEKSHTSEETRSLDHLPSLPTVTSTGHRGSGGNLEHLSHSKYF